MPMAQNIEKVFKKYFIISNNVQKMNFILFTWRFARGGKWIPFDEENQILLEKQWEEAVTMLEISDRHF